MDSNGNQDFEMHPHQHANIFPMLSDAELRLFAADITENCLLDPAVLCDANILDGASRRLARKRLDYEPGTIVNGGKSQRPSILKWTYAGATCCSKKD